MGALIARTILANTTAKILCVCYTNHALDQFLEDLLDKGIDSIVRIGDDMFSAMSSGLCTVVDRLVSSCCTCSLVS